MKTYTLEELRERRRTLNASFCWSNENVQKILILNDRLYSLMLKLRSVLCKMENDFEELIALGKNYYKDYTLEGEICYNGEMPGCDMFLESALETNYANSSWKLALPLDEDSLLDSLNWNIGAFDRPEFQEKYICYLMHDMFHDGPYALQDACNMDPEKFDYSIKVYL